MHDAIYCIRIHLKCYNHYSLHPCNEKTVMSTQRKYRFDHEKLTWSLLGRHAGHNQRRHCLQLHQRLQCPHQVVWVRMCWCNRSFHHRRPLPLPLLASSPNYSGTKPSVVTPFIFHGWCDPHCCIPIAWERYCPPHVLSINIVMPLQSLFNLII